VIVANAKTLKPGDLAMVKIDKADAYDLYGSVAKRG
jgi:hypothetical protein